MDITGFRTLFTPQGQAALDAATEREPREEDFLAHFALSRHFPAEVARPALETAILRREAAAKFPFAGRMYFTREALEQASSWEVSAYRSRRYQSFRRIFDLGCSIGADTLSLATLNPSIGVDLDPLRLNMAQANLRALGLEDRADFLRADLLSPLPLSAASYPGAALFFDPARRKGGRRIFSVQDYHPPLAILKDWLRGFPALGVKISPGVNLEELEGYDAEVEFISLRGELKEAVLWFGPLKGAPRRATLLPGEHSLSSGNTKKDALLALPLSQPLDFLYEPDPAILRAGLVADLGQKLGAAQLDPSIAYLTSRERTETPFARCWAVEDWLPFTLKRLRATLRERGVGRVTVKKRGSPLQPENLIHDLRLQGDEERVVFLTQLRGRPIAILAYSLL